MIGQLRILVDVVKSSMNATIAYIQKEFKKAGSDIEKSFGEGASKGMKNLKKKSEDTLNTINKLNLKLSKLKGELNTKVIGGERFKQLQKEIQKTEKELEKATKTGGGFNGILKNIGGTIAGAFALDKIKDLAGNVLKLGANLEQTTIAFTTILGSADKAKNTLKDLSDFASKTSFEITGIRDTAKQLLAFGFNIEELIPTLKSLGDVSSGLSVPIEQIAYAYGQVRVANQLYGQELMQFTNAGVPLFSKLLDKILFVTEKFPGLTSSVVVGTTALVALGGVIAVLTSALGGLGTVFTFLTGPIGITIASISALTVGLVSLYNQFINVEVQNNKTGKSYNELNKLLEENRKKQQELEEQHKKTGNVINNHREEIEKLKKEEIELQNKLDSTSMSMEDVKNTIDKLNKVKIDNSTNVVELEKERIKALEVAEAYIKTSEARITYLKQAIKDTININQGGNIIGEGTTLQPQILTHDLLEEKGNLKKLNEDFQELEKLKEKLNSTEIISKTDNSDNIINSITGTNSNYSKENNDETIDIEKQRAKELQKLREENYNEDIKLAEQRKKRIKEIEEEKQKKYKESLEVLKEGYEYAGDVIDKVLDESEKNIDSFNKKIKESQDIIADYEEQLENLETGKTDTLGDRFVEIGEREVEIKKELQKLENEGVDENLAKNIGLETLQGMPSGSIFSNNQSVEDLIKVLELQKELNDLKAEEVIISKNVEDKDLEEARRVSELSFTQKYLEKYEVKKKSIQKNYFG